MAVSKQSLRIDPIAKEDATRILAKHPLGAGSTTFSFALGIFWEGKIEGVMTWGNPIVNGAGARLRLRQSEILELRKFWVADVPPSMTESRCLGIAARIIRKRYPQIRCLVTYCEAKEKASAYKGAGWLLLSTSTHANQMTSSNGKVISFRDFTRRGGKKVLGENWTPNKVSKGKWILPLDPSIAAVVQRQDAHLPGGKRRIVTDPAAFIHGDVKEPELTLDPKRFSDCPDLL